VAKARRVNRSGPKSGPSARKFRSFGPAVDALIDQCAQARMAAEKSQRSIATTLGVSASSITKVETRATMLTLARFLRYARVCGFQVTLVPTKEGPRD